MKSIKKLKEEIEKTREELLSIIRPLYDKDYEEIIKIKGKDMLFYGDCCQIEAQLKQTEEIKEIIKGMKKVSHVTNINPSRFSTDEQRRVVELLMVKVSKDFQEDMDKLLSKIEGEENV